MLRKKPVEQSAAIFSWFYKGRGGRFEAPGGLTLFPTPIHSTSPSHSVCSKRYFRPDSFTGFSLSHAFSLFRYLLLSLLFCLYVIKTFCKSQEKPVRFFSFSLALLHCARERNGLITIHNSQTLNGLQPSKKKERKLFPPPLSPVTSQLQSFFPPWLCVKKDCCSFVRGTMTNKAESLALNKRKKTGFSFCGTLDSDTF